MPTVGQAPSLTSGKRFMPVVLFRWSSHSRS